VIAEQQGYFATRTGSFKECYAVSGSHGHGIRIKQYEVHLVTALYSLYCRFATIDAEIAGTYAFNGVFYDRGGGASDQSENAEPYAVVHDLLVASV
jgi:hypothetical protein